MASNKILWRADDDTIRRSRLHHFKKWLSKKGIIPAGEDYDGLWKWSVENPAEFWAAIWDYFDLGERPLVEELLSGDMPNTEWFPGVKLNFAEHVFRAHNDDYPALIFVSERQAATEISWQQLEDTTSKLQAVLKECGVGQGERVGAVIPNIPEATYGFLATSSLGAVWSSCSPDFGPDSIIDRLSQIEPKVIIAVDGYQYGGKAFNRKDVVKHIVREIPSIKHIVLIPYLDANATLDDDRVIHWSEVENKDVTPMRFESVPFDHPLWVLYSSGTTGAPKAITHSHGGILLEHLKYLAFHNDLHRGEKFFWFSTTGWMMWNYIQGALLHGGTVVLYDGSPAYPTLEVLWQMAADIKLEHFGASAPYFVTCMKRNKAPGETYDLSSLRSVSSTGAQVGGASMAV